MSLSREAAAWAQLLPEDGLAGTLVGRIWLPGDLAGPAVVALRSEGVFDLSQSFATMSTLLDASDPAAAVRTTAGTRICSVEALLANSLPGARDEALPWLLAPCDLQVVKAAGVTFATSMIERVNCWKSMPVISSTLAWVRVREFSRIRPLAASEIFLHAAGSGCDSSGGVSDASQPLPGDRHGAGGNTGEECHVGSDQ